MGLQVDQACCQPVRIRYNFSIDGSHILGSAVRQTLVAGCSLTFVFWKTEQLYLFPGFYFSREGEWKIGAVVYNKHILDRMALSEGKLQRLHLFAQDPSLKAGDDNVYRLIHPEKAVLSLGLYKKSMGFLLSRGDKVGLMSLSRTKLVA